MLSIITAFRNSDFKRKQLCSLEITKGTKWCRKKKHLEPILFQNYKYRANEQSDKKRMSLQQHNTLKKKKRTEEK